MIQNHRQLNGIIHVTGEHDTGKTKFALQCGARPNSICFFDDDVKGRATIDAMRDNLSKSGIDFGMYYDLNEIGRGKRHVDFHNAVMKIIRDIRPGQYEAIIFDTWTRFAATCRSMIVANESAYREKWSSMGKIHGAEQSQEAGYLETKILGELSRLAKTVIVTSHLKDHYLNDAKTGKQIPACGRPLETVPIMRVWLRMNPTGSPVPIGLVLKRISIDEWSDEKQAIVTTNVMPRKIVPSETDTSLWDVIWRYYENPIGNRKSTPEETPDEYELSILDGTLTKDQTRTLRLMIERGLIGHDEETAPEVERTIAIGRPVDTTAVKVALAGGKSAAEVAAEFDMPLPEVLKVMRGQQ